MDICLLAMYEQHESVFELNTNPENKHKHTFLHISIYGNNLVVLTHYPSKIVLVSTQQHRYVVIKVTIEESV